MENNENVLAELKQQWVSGEITDTQYLLAVHQYETDNN
jgi:hypothetical protein